MSATRDDGIAFTIGTAAGSVFTAGLMVHEGGPLSTGTLVVSGLILYAYILATLAQ